MNDLNFYIDAAKKRQNINSNNKLADCLKLSRSAISLFINKKNNPTDETILKLAKLGGIAEEQALLDLAIIRNKDNPEALAAWQRIQKKLIKS